MNKSLIAKPFYLIECIRKEIMFTYKHWLFNLYLRFSTSLVLRVKSSSTKIEGYLEIRKVN